jgi:hypothetical protein
MKISLKYKGQQYNPPQQHARKTPLSNIKLLNKDRRQQPIKKGKLAVMYVCLRVSIVAMFLRYCRFDFGTVYFIFFFFQIAKITNDTITFVGDSRLQVPSSLCSDSCYNCGECFKKEIDRLPTVMAYDGDIVLTAGRHFNKELQVKLILGARVNIS